MEGEGVGGRVVLIFRGGESLDTCLTVTEPSRKTGTINTALLHHEPLSGHLQLVETDTSAR